jgi:nucleoside recognition membrane protein YjiH
MKTNTNTAPNRNALSLDKSSYLQGFIKSLLCTLAGVLIFFGSFEVLGYEKNILFGTLVNFMVDLLGTFWYWFVGGIIVINAICWVIGRFFSKEGTLIYEYYKNDGIANGIIYALGAVYAVMIVTKTGSAAVISPNVGGVVYDAVVLQVSWILPLGGMFIPLLLEYGAIDFVGAIFEPLMRPLFKVPGLSAIDAVSSFVSSSSMGVYITSRLYKNGYYTAREACIIATCFSAVSVGFAALAVDTVDLLYDFPRIYLTSFIIAFLVTFVIARIPPLSRKPDVYFDGRTQTEKERKEDAKLSLSLFKIGLDRAVTKAYNARSVFVELWCGLLDGFKLIPKVLPFLSAIGVTGLLIAEYTPLFKWLGIPIIPVLNLLQVPNAAEVSSAVFVGVAEMYLPVLVIAEKGLEVAARYFVVTLSIVQIIFLSETATVMLATGIPIKFKELLICFLERTLIAIPFVALFMHILY